MPVPTETKKQKKLHLSILKQLVKLSTSGFGLVAALAWNSVIQEFVNTYVKPYFAQGSSVISLLIYAILITSLAVIVTYNLTKISEKLEEFDSRIRKSD